MGSLGTYVARTPGQRCQRCGSDISNRARGTLHCSKCQHDTDVENAIKRKERRKLLEARDIAKPLIPWKEGDTDLKCQICGHLVHLPNDKFCYYCGQRLKEDQDV